MKVSGTGIEKIRLGVCNTYLIRGEQGAVLVDAGQAGWAASFLRRLKNHALSPEDIRLIVVTHVHFDHVGNLKTLAQRCGCPVAIHTDEAPLLASGTVVFPPGTNLLGTVAASLGRGISPLLKYAAVTPDILVSDELPLEPFGVPGKILATPGHTQGSVSVLLPDGTACVGDLAANHLPGRIGPVFPPFADNRDRLLQSWRRLLDDGAKTICPGHGPPFAAKHLRRVMRALQDPAPPTLQGHPFSRSKRS
jgi:glyoxylase-like metal-dependent hydrolase (beta-lactamase superfamily II)